MSVSHGIGICNDHTIHKEERNGSNSSVICQINLQCYSSSSELSYHYLGESLDIQYLWHVLLYLSVWADDPAQWFLCLHQARFMRLYGLIWQLVALSLCFICCRLTMKSFGVTDSPSTTTASGSAKGKRSRCALCPRENDKKASRWCSACQKPVCPMHAQLQVICDDCRQRLTKH